MRDDFFCIFIQLLLLIYFRARYATTSHDNYNTKNRPNITLPDVSDYLNNADRDERSSKKIVKKENIPEAQFSFSSTHNSFEYVPNFNLNPLNANIFKFQNDDEFIRHLSSIQPQHIQQQNYPDYSSVKSAQSQFEIVPQIPHAQYYQQILPAKQPTVPIKPPYQVSSVTNRPKLIINVPDEEVADSEDDTRLNHALSLIHSQPHIKNKLENLHKYPSFPLVTSTPPPTYVTPKIQDSGVVVINGHPKYTNYGYRYSENQDPTYIPIFQSNKYQAPQNNSGHFQVETNRQNIPLQFSSSRGIYNTNFQPNTQQKKQNYIPEKTLNMQHSYPVLLFDSKAKIGLPFYPTSRNIYNVPYDSTFQYEGIPTAEEREQTFGVNVPVFNVPADRRLHTGLIFHASSRNLYDDNTPSLRNPPLQKGDTIWQAGDETTGDEPELLVRQLNETCAYVQWNETTPGNEDGTRYNIWNVGDYSAQLQTETLIRSLNITCDNYTLDALNNFTSGYTLTDYCSQCLRNDSSDIDSDPEIDQRFAYNQESGNQEIVQNQQESYQPQNVQQEPGYDYNNQQIYNNFYQQGPTNYEFYVDNNNHGYNQFYKRKRYAENSKSL